MKTVSVVVPFYNEEDNVVHFYQELKRETQLVADTQFAFVFVDDGSTDRTLENLKSISRRDPAVRLVQLSRNFGKEVAVTAGLDEVHDQFDSASIGSADAMIIMDGDLQHPTLIPEFVRRWQQGYEVVSTRRLSVQSHSWWRRWASSLYYRIFNALADFRIQPGTTDFRLLDRSVVQVLRQFSERNRMLRGLIDWCGFKTTVVEFHAPSRNAKGEGYSAMKLATLAMDSIVSFSLVPLVYTMVLGSLICLVFGGLLMVMLVDRFAFANHWGFSPLSFVVVTNSFLVGLIVFCLGWVAIYLGRAFKEVQNRPLYVARTWTSDHATPWGVHTQPDKGMDKSGLQYSSSQQAVPPAEQMNHLNQAGVV